MTTTTTPHHGITEALDLVISRLQTDGAIARKFNEREVRLLRHALKLAKAQGKEA